MPASYGTWTSPITPGLVASAALRLGSVTLDGEDIYWIEGRPDEGGRNVLVRRTPDGVIADVTPAANVRSRVHEYGGGAYTISSRVVYYVNFADQRWYRLEPGGVPEPLTTAGSWFHGDACVDARRGRLISVREDHTDAAHEATTTIVSVPLAGSPSAGEIIVTGHDFYSTPRLSPDGSRLSWLAWRHPNMPWDGTELWIAEVSDDGTIERRQHVTGNGTDAIFQPGWSPDNTLYFVSDRSGWWNLYRLRDHGIEQVHAIEADFGRPQWQLGMSTWAFADRSRIVVAYQRLGRWRTGVLDLQTNVFTPIRVDLEPGETIAASPRHAVFVGGSTIAPDALVRVDLNTATVQTIRAASDVMIDAAYVSEPQAIEFPTGNDLTAHAFYYAPRNPHYATAGPERPPLVVISHGGPTASTSARLNLEVQFWTSRGFAVVDVNYGGSSGFGRAYRQRLNGQWGVTDVADCVHAVEYLTAGHKADSDRVVIRGRSAGGYTALAALTLRPDVFKAGASYYGVSDLEVLARETHKFESRYLERLIGPFPERGDLYHARSPFRLVNRLSRPVIFFQGLDDQVVPPNQSLAMAEAMRQRGIDAELLMFEGEQHGFRRSETIARCLEAELTFYRRVLNLPAADRGTYVPQ